MQTHLVWLRATALVITTAIVSACQSDTQTQEKLKVSAPSQILAVRAIDIDLLQPQVRLSNGDALTLQRGADNSWSGTINVQPNSTYFVQITWIEAMPEGNLVLAQWEQNVAVDADGTQVNLGSGDYDYSADFDGDNINNITERRNDTNPFVHNDNVIADNTDNTDNNDVPDTDNNQDDAEPEPNTPVDNTETNGDTNSDDTETNDDTNSDNDNTDPQTNTDDDTQNDNNSSTVATVRIPRIEPGDAPSLDGQGVQLDGQDRLAGEWESAVQFDLAGDALLIDRLMIDINADSEDGAPYRRWAAMHDGINLYVVVLSDDTGARHADSENVWEDDSLEVFIDADNSKLPVWGDADDFHYMIPLLEFNTRNANTPAGRIQAGPGSSDVELDIAFHTGPGEGPDGIRIEKWEQDVYELAIPLAAAGIQTGLAFGLELQINDDDNGEGRDSKWGWFHPSRQNNTDTDTSYLNPSVMGTVVLVP